MQGVVGIAFRCVIAMMGGWKKHAIFLLFVAAMICAVSAFVLAVMG